MIVHVLRLTRWEWFKLRHRWMPWILLGIVALVVQITLLAYYISYQSTDYDREFRHGFSLSEPRERGEVSARSEGGGFPTIEAHEEDPVIFTCHGFKGGRLPPEVESLSETEQARFREICAEEAEQERLFREKSRQSFILPDSLSNSLGVAHTIGVFLVVILASSAIGVEYGWGTLRTVLTRGTGRWQLLMSKVFALVLIVAAGLLFLSLTIIASSLAVSLLTLSDGFGLADSGEWSTAAVMFGKTVYGLTPYALLAIFFTVLTTSVGSGTAVSLGYYFGETIVFGFLVNMFDGFDGVADFLLGHNAVAWMAETGVQTTRGLASPIPLHDLPDNLHAFVVLLGYIVVLGAATLLLFVRRDVAGAKGA